MHEVITLANSHSSGHLLAQVYNVQESHLAYSREKKLTHSNDVFLRPTRVNGRTNYYPRAINVEFSGGYGYMSKFQYHEKTEDVDILAQQYGSVVVEQPVAAEKNEYQKCLDRGIKPQKEMLTVENTKFWTSYNKLIYKPTSLLELQEYQHPDGTNKNFSRLRFEEYPVGEQEFSSMQNIIDDTFRNNLEALDNIQGINFVSELDNAWGGFTNELMMEIKDEYFNNGANSKHNLWTYGLYSHADPSKNILTQIRSFIGFAQQSTLFIPIQVPSLCPGILSDGYDPSSFWHRASMLSLVVNSIWGLNCQLDLAVRMATVEAKLLKGFEKRTIVNEIELQKKEQKSQFGIILDVNIMDYYLNPSAVVDLPPSSKNLQLGFSHDEKAKQLSRVDIGDSKTENTFENKYMQEPLEQDSFPEIFETPFEFATTLKQTTSIRQKLKEYQKIVSRVRLPHHIEIIGDKGELIEEISSLIEEYTVGYSDESDIDD